MSLAFPCPFEQAHGRPCVICREGSGLFPAEHPDHLLIADDADRRAARDLYVERGYFLEPPDFAWLSRDDRTALDAWAATPEPLPEYFAAMAHTPREGDPGHCAKCQQALTTVSETAYPVGTFVGLDCEGTP